MKIKFLLLLTVVVGMFIARADDEKFPLLKIGNDIYTNVIVTHVTASDISFIHAGGAANAKLKDLSPELQKQFNYDPKQAKAAEQKLAENKAKYHEQLLHQPQAPDISRQPDAAGAPPAWLNGLAGVLQKARAENKLVLLDFTGSDWCSWCIKFDQEVLSTPQFNAYGNLKLEFVKVDFPHNTPQSPELKQANDGLAKQLNVTGFPTFVLLNTDGRELGRQVGYLAGGPDAFIAELEKFSAR